MFEPEKYVPEEGDLVLQPTDDDSPEALVTVIPSDGRTPFRIQRKYIVGLPDSYFSVDTSDEVPESVGFVSERFVSEGAAVWAVRRALLLGGGLGLLAGGVAGVLIGAALWA